jgi:hypothetical protein
MGLENVQDCKFFVYSFPSLLDECDISRRSVEDGLVRRVAIENISESGRCLRCFSNRGHRKNRSLTRVQGTPITTVGQKRQNKFVCCCCWLARQQQGDASYYVGRSARTDTPNTPPPECRSREEFPNWVYIPTSPQGTFLKNIKATPEKIYIIRKIFL